MTRFMLVILSCHFRLILTLKWHETLVLPVLTVVQFQERVLERCSAPSSSAMPGTPPSSSSCSHTPSWDSPCQRLWVSSVSWWRSCCCLLSKLFILRTLLLPSHMMRFQWIISGVDGRESNVWKPHPHSDARTDVLKCVTLSSARHQECNLFNYVV